MAPPVLRTLAGTVALVTLTASVGTPAAAAPPRDRSPFAYDATAPLAARDRLVSRSGGIELHDLAYRVRGRRVRAFLVLPASARRHPAVVYLHGGAGGRGQLLGEARRMAERGAVALTLELPYARARVRPLGRGLAGLRRSVGEEVQAVVEVRRALDLLQARDDVRGRIAVAGWSAGARTAALVAGAERRVAGFDLLAGGAVPPELYARQAPPALRATVLALLRRVDPLRGVAHAAPTPLLFQNGLADEVVPRAALRALARAGSRPKRVVWYRSGHRPSPRAWADSRRWLAARLGLRR